MQLPFINPSLTVKYVKNPAVIIFSAIWLTIFTIKYKEVYQLFLNTTSKSWGLSIVFFLFTFYFIYQLIWNLFGETTFTIVEDKVIIRVGIYFFKTDRILYKNKITKVEYKSDVKTNTYWNFQGIRIYNKAKAIIFRYNAKAVTQLLYISTDDLLKIEVFFIRLTGKHTN